MALYGNLLAGTNAVYNIGSSGTTFNNVYAQNYYGNGATLTGIITSVSNINNGTSNVTVVSSGGNIAASVGGTSNVMVIASSGVTASNLIISGNLTVNGNTTSVNYETATIISASGNITGANFLTGGAISATGNVTANNISASNIINSNNFVANTTTTVSSSANISLTTSSTYNQITTGSASQNYFLPVATGSIVGTVWLFNNNSSQPVYIYYQDASLLCTIAAGSLTEVQLLNNSTTNGTWDRHSFLPSYASWGSSTLAIGGANITGATNISATGNITGANLVTGGLITATGNITGGNVTTAGILTVNSGAAATAIVNGAGNTVGNIGSSSVYFNRLFAQATTALYADLAECYLADADYEPGTVMDFGGDYEVTLSTTDSSKRVSGVVSTNPAHVMNSGLTGDHVVTVALIGRVPVKVTGVIRKGDLMVSAGNGRARAVTIASPKVGTIIGKALENFDGGEGTIEIVIGKQ